MSIRVMSEVWDHCHLSGSSLLVVLAMADYCNDERKCWPSTKTLGTKARLSQRYTQRIIGRLEDAGYVKVHREAGPYGTNIYELATGEQMKALKPLESEGEWAPHDAEKGMAVPPGDDRTASGGDDRTDVGGMAVPPPNPSLNLHSEPSTLSTPNGVDRGAKRSARNRTADARSKHPAVLLVKGITGRNPPKALYDKVILIAGEHPDGERAADCYRVWCERGYNANALTWLTEWYVVGVPGRNGNGYGRASPMAGVDAAIEQYLREEGVNGNGGDG